MSIRLNITISDDLNNEIDKATAESETNKSEIFRKALTLYLAMYEGRKNGSKADLVDLDTHKKAGNLNHWAMSSIDLTHHRRDTNSASRLNA